MKTALRARFRFYVVDAGVQLYIQFICGFRVGSKERPREFRKHGIHFADAVSVFEDDAAITISDPFSEHEKRWVTIGMDGLGRLLDVVYVERRTDSNYFRMEGFE